MKVLSNKEIARLFNEVGKLMELHGENPFKTKAYSQAYMTFRKVSDPILLMTIDERQELPGIGKAIAEKCEEIKETGSFQLLEKYRSLTPENIQALLKIKGLGPKKVKALWDHFGEIAPGELAYACKENRLIELSGFGEKTQAQILKQTELFLDAQGKMLFPLAEELYHEISIWLKEKGIQDPLEPAGEFARGSSVINQIEVKLISDSKPSLKIKDDDLFQIIQSREDLLILEHKEKEIKLFLWVTPPKEKNLWTWLLDTGISWKQHYQLNNNSLEENRKRIQKIPDAKIIELIPKELLDDNYWCYPNHHKEINQLVQLEDIQGVIHLHTTWSDGIASIQSMAETAKKEGYHYLVVTDHSKAAFYANGLNEDRLKKQIDEIQSLNAKLKDFKIFTGCEVDILNNGELDLSEELLAALDCVIVSVHSNLKMTQEKAMERISSALEHSQVNILGHPTGRLLLAREGYGLDMTEIIRICAKNKVAIELNSNPQRLDVDETHIRDIMHAGVSIAINPDAHQPDGIKDIRFGVQAARRGGLRKDFCINHLTADAFLNWCQKK